MTQHPIEAERCTLAACLIDPNAADKVCALLVPEDFTLPLYRDAFTIIAALNARRSPIDIVTVATMLGQGRMADLFEIVNSVTSGAHATHHASLVLAASKLRTLSSIAIDLAHQCEHTSATTESVEVLLESLRVRLDEILARTPGRRPIKLADAEPDLLPRIIDNAQTPNGIETGFPDIDRALGGLRDGEMIVLAARPSVGKSLLAANIAENLTLGDTPRAVLFLSLEMSASQLYRRYLFARSGVEARIALAGQADSTDKQNLAHAHAEAKRAPWYVHHEAALSAQRAQALARAFKNKHGPCVLVLDYLQLMSGPGYNRTEVVSNLSAAMKGLAVDLDCPVLVLSQLNRQAADARERNGETRVVIPTLSDLRDSGAIEQDADVVMFLARDITKRETHPCEVVLAKNRPGRTGSVQVLFNVRGPRFQSIAKSEKWDGTI